ncbi:hypothetical protein MPTK1_4g09290 [Marchantia polymorpha subsp. ruderalis]|uniref:High-affinity nitrate transporter n=2 Tax=Marchantia polymorpha TaxID=3197 RepID=A0AAF6B818_MARPO|nr:hypothetical protein MARPO_0112s0029 [Marchantia polymorpha]BBN08152.1 hypothetical protein Mp_4g09290 [Marchantia polymorpha subsp. ruderalis]|eukprot:PTQ31376.1 hypothetical protein MARPO_0112s0029 [Marchantia polymorpha]
MACCHKLLAVTVLFAALFQATEVEGGVRFSTLERNLVVNAQIQSQNVSSGVAKVGVDSLAVQWNLNSSLEIEVDSEYASVKVKLCFAPKSQIDRGWRKTDDDLQRDNTCPKEIATKLYRSEGNFVVWRIPKNVPGGEYFVRAYVLDTQAVELAYGQNTDDAKTTNLITIIPITGRLPSIDIAGIVLSLFSVVSLCSFLLAETLLGRKPAMS